MGESPGSIERNADPLCVRDRDERYSEPWGRWVGADKRAGTNPEGILYEGEPRARSSKSSS